MRKVEGGEPDFSRNPRPHRTPAQAARDHQMQEEEQIAFQRKHQPLAEPLHLGEDPTMRLGWRRLSGSQNEGIGEPDSLKAAADSDALKRLTIQGSGREVQAYGEAVGEGPLIASNSPTAVKRRSMEARITLRSCTRYWARLSCRR